VRVRSTLIYTEALAPPFRRQSTLAEAGGQGMGLTRFRQISWLVFRRTRVNPPLGRSEVGGAYRFFGVPKSMFDRKSWQKFDGESVDIH
jgi:hypothetical protein